MQVQGFSHVKSLKLAKENILRVAFHLSIKKSWRTKRKVDC